ncbi:MAG: HAD hydrolase-like protein [Caldilineaceae bacterium]
MPDPKDPLDINALSERMEPLSPAEIEQFLARVRAQGRSLTAAEQYALFGPRSESDPQLKEETTKEEVTERAAAYLDATQLAKLQHNFFPELGDSMSLPAPRLVQGLIIDFDDTLAYLTRPQDELWAAGAQAAEAYMRSTGMELPADFWQQIIEARRFAEEKSEEEREEHIADDALSFLLQFVGYPVSKMDRAVLRQAVDIFYAPEMTAWALQPGVLTALQALQAANYKLALIVNYNCDRVFQRTVDYLGIRPYFDLVLTSAAVEYRKPDVRIFTLALERWNALPYEIVVVGDSLRHDIQGGLELGALTVQSLWATSNQVTFDNQQLAQQVSADAQIEDWHTLPALIQDWAQP